MIRRPVAPAPLDEPVTEVFANAKVAGPAPDPERRYSAPSGFDGSTQRMEPTPEPETEVFAAAVPPRTQEQPTKTAAPQAIPARGEDKPPARKRSWGWVVAVLLVIAALVAVAALATALLTRDKAPVVSQEDLVRDAITQFDTAIKKGDLAAIRSLTCGETLENYVNVDDGAWLALHERVTAAEEYPVVASIDQVVINGEHAEANVTTFMAKASEVRSTRSFDLQFRDNQWKICQGPVG
ncbi:MAG: Rv0361 family membrane protein [Mycobacterium sp.]